MSEIENELLGVVDLSSKEKGWANSNRQKYLSALARYISDQLSDDDYKSLSDATVKWYEGAVYAIDNKKEISDFPDVVVGDGSTGDEGERVQDPRNTAADEDEIDPTSEATVHEEEAEPEAAPPATPKKRGAKEPTRYDNMTDQKSRYGIIIGTKAHEATVLFEKGRTMAQIKEALDGTYYNLKKKLAEEGHLFEKLEGGIWKLTHKDDVKK